MYALIIRLNSTASIPAGTKCLYQVNVYEHNHMQLRELLYSMCSSTTIIRSVSQKKLMTDQWHAEIALAMMQVSATLSSCFRSRSWYEGELHCDSKASQGQSTGAEYKQNTTACPQTLLEQIFFPLLKWPICPTSHLPQNMNNVIEDLVFNQPLSVWTLRTISEHQYLIVLEKSVK